MKTSFPLAAVAGIVCASLFVSCTKNDMKPAESVNAQNSSNGTTGEDKIDAILSDLSTDSYSLSFTKTYRKSGITRKAYGTDNYLDFADPQDLICGDRIRVKYKQIPIWKRPNIIWPTCPDMVIDINKLTEIQQLIISADPKLYEGLQQVKFMNAEGGFLGTPEFTKQFPAMELDKIDDATSNLSLDRFLMLNNPSALGGGATRSFYGYADLNEIVFKPYKKSLKDILKPTLKGCFDPETLKSLRSQLQKVDREYYANLRITYLPEDKNIAIMQ